MSSLWPAISGVCLTINEKFSVFPDTIAFPLTATNSVVNPSSASEPLLSDHCISSISNLVGLMSLKPKTSNLQKCVLTDRLVSVSKIETFFWVHVYLHTYSWVLNK